MIAAVCIAGYVAQVDEAAIQADCADALAHYKQPRTVPRLDAFAAELDRKVARAEVRGMFSAAAGWSH